MSLVSWPQTIENKAALRTAIAALTAVLISFKLHLETPYWSGMSVVVVSNLYTGSIIDKATLRIIGTLVGAVLGFYITGLVANSLMLYLLSCFLIVAIGTYYYSFSINGYAYLLGALCAFIIISQLAFTPQNAFFVAIWRPVEIAIGVVVSALSAYFIFPNYLKDNIFEQIKNLFGDFNNEFQHLEDLLQQGTTDFSPLAVTNLAIKKKIRKAVELIGAMNHELGVTQARTDEVRALLESFYDLTRQQHYLINLSPEQKELKLNFSAIFQAIKNDLSQLQQAFIKRTTKIVELETTDELTKLEEDWPRYKNDFIDSLVHFFQQVHQSLVLIQSLLARVPGPKIPKIKVLSMQDRLRTDPDLIRRSIKAGLSVILALGFWMTSSWPGGINGIISSIVISIRKNLFEMKNVSIHRLIGCLVGGSTALVPLYFIALNLYDFIVLLFFAVWAFSYFMFKYPKYSYIGLQANIALIISLAQEGGPPVALEPPLERLGGIVIGIAASFIVANLIWRSDIWTILRRYLSKLEAYMTYNLQQILLGSAKQKKIHELANLFWLSRGLLESLSDESLSPRKEAELADLMQRFESLVMTQATISHIFMVVDHEKMERIATLFACDLKVIEERLIVCFAKQDTVGGLQLSHQLTELVDEVKNQSVQLNQKDLHAFLIYLQGLSQVAKIIGAKESGG